MDLVLDGDGRAARCLTELRALLAVCDEPAVEHALVLARLRAALGLAEGAPSAGPSEERARAVVKEIRRALSRIAESDPRLGALISAVVHTARQSVYLPVQL